ncbi:hypothetical protein Leryth_010441 [Lithospermum erythrorhizon]|nr:hypothetical protein Leryth_010441 [Lithospermum erythrorhizon]
MAVPDYWEELPCGVYSVYISDGIDGKLVGEVTKHQWADPSVLDLIRWERCAVEPTPEENYISHRKFCSLERAVHGVHIEILSDPGITSVIKEPLLLPSQKLLTALKDSVKRRATLSSISKAAVFHGIKEEVAPVAVLFSGGLDSMIIASLLHQCIDAKYEIDLLNVSFDGSRAPDRISALAGVNELGKFAPSRRWNLVEIDSDLPSLSAETKHVMSLLNPAKTYMDLNIGIALWLAARGEGRVYERQGNIDANVCDYTCYKSNARILLVGSGADEQCAGYGRHKTKYKHSSWFGLHEEMKLDMQRIWKRNLGRDDRCIADSGKEARFPFLDENVIGTLLDIPLWEIADLDQPSGIGDKKILREVARMLGLSGAAGLPKRAIQFGTRIARESNKKNFGSNRAANQASAGSVVIYGPSK